MHTREHKLALAGSASAHEPTLEAFLKLGEVKPAVAIHVELVEELSDLFLGQRFPFMIRACMRS